MSDLTDFLLARIAEDEAAARDAAGGQASTRPDFTIAGWPDCEYPGRVVIVGLERFVAECEAKWRIVERHGSRHVMPEDIVSCICCGALGEYDAPHPCDTLLDLAAVYADNPDYREEWRA